MATKVSICSNALLMLGSPAISSFDDGTDISGLVSNIYEESRDSLLRSHLWNFAIKRVQLASESTTPVSGYAYQHALPADCLRLIEVEDIRDFTIERRKVLTDESPINIKYVERVTDVSLYDASFIELLQQKIIAEIAYTITKSETKSQNEMQKFAAMLRQARFIDSTEDPAPQFDRSIFLTTRYQGYGKI